MRRPWWLCHCLIFLVQQCQWNEWGGLLMIDIINCHPPLRTFLWLIDVQNWITEKPYSPIFIQFRHDREGEMANSWSTIIIWNLTMIYDVGSRACLTSIKSGTWIYFDDDLCQCWMKIWKASSRTILDSNSTVIADILLLNVIKTITL